MRRILMMSLGALFFGIGTVGAFLPVLPTTPFMLLALWFFSRSSQRLHEYILHHRIYGPLVEAWRVHGAVPRSAKITALGMMLASAVFLVFFFDGPLIAIVAALALMSVGAVFLLTRPTARL